MTISESLKRFRQYVGINKKEATEAAGIAQSSYLYENEGEGKIKTTPSVLTVMKWSEKFKISTDYILGLTDNPEQKKASAGQMTISESLKRFRRYVGINKTEAAEAAGIAQPSYWQYEIEEENAKKSIPTVLPVIKWSEKFKVSTDYILGLTDNPEQEKSEHEPEKEENTQLEEGEKIKELQGQIDALQVQIDALRLALKAQGLKA